MYSLTANFHPAKETKNGYIGKADITIANAIRLNNISVFEKEEGGLAIVFGKFRSVDDKGEYHEHSCVIPSSTEAYAAMIAVIDNAIHSENNFGFTKGDVGVRLEVSGSKVNEPYADGRYSIKVGDFCTLKGVSTREVSIEKDGKSDKFVAVNLPRVLNENGKVSMYTDREGNKRANLQFEGLTVSWKDKEGKDQSVDYAQRINEKVRAKRKELLEPTIDEKIAASKKKGASGKTKRDPKKGNTKDSPEFVK